MGRPKRRSILGQQIAEILGTGTPFASAGQHTAVNPAATRSLLLGGVALLTLNPSQVSAVGLGDIVLESRLGEPLRATVPMNVTQGETLPANCVTATSRQTELRVPDRVRVASPPASVAGNYTVQISTLSPLHEPMYELSLVVKCPNVPLFVHHYILLIELPDYPVQPATIDIEKTVPSASTAPTDSRKIKTLAPASPA